MFEALGNRENGVLGPARIIWALNKSDTQDCGLYNGADDINPNPALGGISKPLNVDPILCDGEPPLPCPKPYG